MTIQEVLHSATRILQAKQISSAHLDAEVLLAFVIKKPREYLLAHDEKNLTVRQVEAYAKLIARRSAYEPVAYLIGTKDFYGLSIKVDNTVLIPRPETELLVDEVINFASTTDTKSPKTPIFDIGTGSGVIALALAKSLPKAQIWALDSSLDALNLAKINARRLKVKIKPVYSNLLDNVKPSLLAGSIIVANLPYLDKQEIKDFPLEIKRGLKFEPQGALYASKRGTGLYEKLFRQLNKLSVQPRILVAEIGSHHWREFLQLTNKHFPQTKIAIKKDLAKRPRILVIEF